MGIDKKTDQNVGIGEIKESKMWVIARSDRTKIVIRQTQDTTDIFFRPFNRVALDPHVRDPSRSDQYFLGSWTSSWA